MIVLDASVALKLFLPEAGSEAALRLLASGTLLAAPDILPLEVSAAITKYHRRRLITLEEARAVQAGLSHLPIELHPWPPLATVAFELSLLLRRSAYDCLYLALARQLMLPMVTADLRLKDKTETVGLSGRVHGLSDVERLLDELSSRPTPQERP